MTNPQKSAVKVLNELVAICKDGKMRFKTAAEGFKDPELRAFCLQLSKQRAAFINELQEEVRQLGGDPDSTGTILGSLHRNWSTIKSDVTDGDDDSILSECERGEEEAKETFEKALNAYTPANITGIIQRQYLQIKAAHERFRSMQKVVH